MCKIIKRESILTWEKESDAMIEDCAFAIKSWLFERNNPLHSESVTSSLFTCLTEIVNIEPRHRIQACLDYKTLVKCMVSSGPEIH